VSLVWMVICMADRIGAVPSTGNSLAGK
jgi:hypothetical protein